MVYDEWAETLRYNVNSYPGADYDLLMSVEYLPGMAVDFRDIRISDGLSNKLNYWIEDFTAGVSATIHVKLGLSSTIFLHYGNGSAVSESNGSNVFIFFEDFSDGLSASKWHLPDSQYYSVSNGELTVTGDGAADHIVWSENTYNISTNILRIKHKVSDYTKSYIYNGYAGYGTARNMTTAYITSFGFQSSDAKLVTVHHGINWYCPSISNIANNNNYYISELRKAGSTDTITTKDSNGTVGSTTSSSYTSAIADNYIYLACYTGCDTTIDYVALKKYVITEPTVTLVNSLPANTENSRFFKAITGVPYRTSGISVSNIKSIVNVTNTHSTRTSGVYPAAIKVGNTYNYHFDRFSGIFVDEVYSDIRQKNIAFSRSSSMSTTVKIGEHRNTHSERTASAYVQSPFSEKGSRNFYTYRYYPGQGWLVADAACKTTVERHLEVNAGMSIPTTALLFKRYYWGYVADRESGDYIEAQRLIAEWEAHLNREASVEIPSIEINSFPEIGRETAVNVSQIYAKGSRLVGNHMSSGMYLSQIGLKARINPNFHRESSIEVYPVLSTASRTGSFNRTSGSSVLIVGTGGIGEALIGRISELYIDDVTVKAERILHAVRQSALESSEPCVIAFGATNYELPYSPFEIDLVKTDFIITVDQPEYGVVLDKGLYYAVIRGGLTMIEITQFDTDTFFGYIYDTDPITGESRAMPLAGKTVKAVLKGGSPDTTVTVDCTVVEAGKVRISLSSSDTSVVGKYFLRFVILGDGYRKEVPENRDDYLEVQINDASYPNL